MRFLNVHAFGKAVAILALLSLLAPINVAANSLHREAAPKPVYTSLPNYLNTDQIVLKFAEGISRPEFEAKGFTRTGSQWDMLNSTLASQSVSSLANHFQTDLTSLEQMRSTGIARTGVNLPDMTLYFDIHIDKAATPNERLELIAKLNDLDIVEFANFTPIPSLPIVPDAPTNWEEYENYLQAAPTGLHAYAGWAYPGGKGENIKVIDIEGNWVEHHEDLRGGHESFHIAGSKIIDPGWWNHGTAVLGEIAADSNGFGMTGMAYNVDLGTVSIGSMSLDEALAVATANSDTGDIILIELQYGGPNGGAYVPAEYYQQYFDAILLASSLGRIVVEAGANGSQDLDDEYWYGNLFDPEFRFSGAIMVAAGNANHVPEWFTSYGQRLDVHGFGSEVYTLGYGDLAGADTTNYYTANFGGTSSASPMIVGACAVLQGISKNNYAIVLDHNELRDLLKTYSTPQAPSPQLIGPMPDLLGSTAAVAGVTISADATIGWAPFDVNFTGSSTMQVDTWTWSLGDGDSAFVQSPNHTYTTAGMFDVSLEIAAGEEVRSTQRDNYIIVLADSMIASDTGGWAGDTVEVVIYGRNTVPIKNIIIPIEYSGDLDLTLVTTFSTEGCRTDFFESQAFTHYSPASKRATINLWNSTSGAGPALEPGTGPIAKVYFVISGSPGQSTPIVLDGYNSNLPYFGGSIVDYEPMTAAGQVLFCLERGNVNLQPGVDVGDLTWLVDFLFNGGPQPIPMAAGDVNCQNGVNVADVTHLVDYLFNGGPPPCGC